MAASDKMNKSIEKYLVDNPDKFNYIYKNYKKYKREQNRQQQIVVDKETEECNRFYCPRFFLLFIISLFICIFVETGRPFTSIATILSFIVFIPFTGLQC